MNESELSGFKHPNLAISHPESRLVLQTSESLQRPYIYNPIIDRQRGDCRSNGVLSFNRRMNLIVDGAVLGFAYIQTGHNGENQSPIETGQVISTSVGLVIKIS